MNEYTKEVLLKQCCVFTDNGTALVNVNIVRPPEGVLVGIVDENGESDIVEYDEWNLCLDNGEEWENKRNYNKETLKYEYTSKVRFWFPVENAESIAKIVKQIVKEEGTNDTV